MKDNKERAVTETDAWEDEGHIGLVSRTRQRSEWPDNLRLRTAVIIAIIIAGRSSRSCYEVPHGGGGNHRRRGVCVRGDTAIPNQPSHEKYMKDNKERAVTETDAWEDEGHIGLVSRTRQRSEWPDNLRLRTAVITAVIIGGVARAGYLSAGRFRRVAGGHDPAMRYLMVAGAIIGAAVYVYEVILLYQINQAMRNI